MYEFENITGNVIRSLKQKRPCSPYLRSRNLWCAPSNFACTCPNQCRRTKVTELKQKTNKTYKREKYGRWTGFSYVDLRVYAPQMQYITTWIELDVLLFFLLQVTARGDEMDGTPALTLDKTFTAEESKGAVMGKAERDNGVFSSLNWCSFLCIQRSWRRYTSLRTYSRRLNLSSCWPQ